MKRVAAWLMRAQEAAICVVSKWWRPVTFIGIAGGTVVNFIVIPLSTWELPDLAAGAAWITAATAAMGLRSWEKKHGIARASTSQHQNKPEGPPP